MSLDELKAAFEKANHKSGVTVTNTGPFLEPPYEKCKGDGYRVDFPYKGKKTWITYDNSETAYEKAALFCRS